MPDNIPEIVPKAKGGALAHLATEILTELDAVRAAVETAAEHAIRVGHLLTKAKELNPHGDWLPWLEGNFGLSTRSAQAYMTLARRHAALDDPKAQRVAYLPLRDAMRAVAETIEEASTVQVNIQVYAAQDDAGRDLIVGLMDEVWDVSPFAVLDAAPIDNRYKHFMCFPGQVETVLRTEDVPPGFFWSCLTFHRLGISEDAQHAILDMLKPGLVVAGGDLLEGTSEADAIKNGTATLEAGAGS